jgi:hypothetical protein
MIEQNQAGQYRERSHDEMMIANAKQAAMAKQSSDPWVHRSSGMRCRSCIWYVPKVPTSPLMPQDYRGIGRCRRHAPTMNGYPVVWCDDWCGDHRLDENKL